MDFESVDDVGMTEFLPDIHTLFQTYNTAYFEGYLGKCLLEWSDKMTLCAGICYSKREGGVMSCTVRLSRKLLQYRPFSDTINTLLHEMIHAYIFMKFGGTLERDGHGPDFQAVMDRINKAAGSNITVYHTFHEEVKACRVHVWRCQGPCQDRAPFYGWCRRSMNRPPQPADWWWSNHQKTCGGQYIKISGPPDSKKKRKTEGRPITSYFSKLGKSQKLGGDAPPPTRKAPAAVKEMTEKLPECKSDSLHGVIDLTLDDDNDDEFY